MKEHEKLVGNPNFYNFWTSASYFMEGRLFERGRATEPNRVFHSILVRRGFGQENSIETVINLYQSIERKLLYIIHCVENFFDHFGWEKNRSERMRVLFFHLIFSQFFEDFHTWLESAQVRLNAVL